jgi:ADP-ribosylglycohydrolase
MNRRDSIAGCILGGAIGDAFGGRQERGRLSLSDDTQLTLATCDSIAEAGRVDPAHIAEKFRSGFEEHRLIGLGSSTLKALRDLAAGAHWALAGASGEMAAGNGAAMRIAPLAFSGSDRTAIRDVARITHRSDEAYVGALTVVEAIRTGPLNSPAALLTSVAAALPDSRVRDALIQVAGRQPSTLTALAAHFGSSGYVVDTVPLALAAGWAMAHGPFEAVIGELVSLGGDTDTIASIAGQVAGAWMGAPALPGALVDRIPERALVADAVDRYTQWVEQTVRR